MNESMIQIGLAMLEERKLAKNRLGAYAEQAQGTRRHLKLADIGVARYVRCRLYWLSLQ